MKRPMGVTILSTVVAMIFAGVWTTALANGDYSKGPPEKYKTLCASCHGESGKGNGPAADALKAVAKVRDFTDGAYMNARTDAQLTKVIKEGGAATGLSPLMAAFGGQLSNREIFNILDFIRSVAKPKYQKK